MQDADLDRNVSREITVGGIVFTGSDEANASQNPNELGAVLFGVRRRASKVTVLDGAFSMTAVGAPDRTRLQRMGKGYDPDGTVAMLFVKPGSAMGLPVWENYRDPDDQNYNGGRFLGFWQPNAVPDDQGGPDDMVRAGFAGKCDAPIDIRDGFVRGRKVAVTLGGGNYTGTLGETPDTALENDDNVLAVYLGSGPAAGPILLGEFDFSGNCVDGTGAISIATTRLGRLGFDPTFAFAALHDNGTGTYANDGIVGATDNLWTAI